MDINIDQELCTRCDACLALCLVRVYGRLDGRVEVVAAERCWLCGHCVAVCPADAIAHSGYPIQECPALDPAVLPSLDGLVGLLRERRSSRVFLDQPVERQVVRELVDVVRWGPSASNEQPVEWLAFDDPDRIAELRGQAVAVLAQTVRLLRSRLLRPFLRLAYGPEKVEKAVENTDAFEGLVECHARGEDLVFFHAPVVLMAHVPDTDYFGRDDAVYAAYNLMLAAQRMGLGTCQIGFFGIALDRSRGLRRALGLPEGRHVEVVLVLGYPKHRFHRLPSRRRPAIVWDGN